MCSAISIYYHYVGCGGGAPGRGGIPGGIPGGAASGIPGCGIIPGGIPGADDGGTDPS